MKLTLQRTGHKKGKNIKVYLKGIGYEALNPWFKVYSNASGTNIQSLLEYRVITKRVRHNIA
jgi:hypothetical protein